MLIILCLIFKVTLNIFYKPHLCFLLVMTRLEMEARIHFKVLTILDEDQTTMKYLKEHSESFTKEYIHQSETRSSQLQASLEHLNSIDYYRSLPPARLIRLERLVDTLASCPCMSDLK